MGEAMRGILAGKKFVLLARKAHLRKEARKALEELQGHPRSRRLE